MQREVDMTIFFSHCHIPCALSSPMQALKQANYFRTDPIVSDSTDLGGLQLPERNGSYHEYQTKKKRKQDGLNQQEAKRAIKRKKVRDTSLVTVDPSGVQFPRVPVSSLVKVSYLQYPTRNRPRAPRRGDVLTRTKQRSKQKSSFCSISIVCGPPPATRVHHRLTMIEPNS